jgi:phenylacetic acid degradation operon negative regulatory protein
VTSQTAEAVRPPSPRRLVLALIGELYLGGSRGPYRAVDIVDVLRSAGVSASTARAALDRFVLRGLLDRRREGRGVTYSLTDAGEQVIADGSARVHAVAPFEPKGEGWTVVTFSVPEGKRGLRHQLRAVLNWAGFAPLRDGVWVASGERDLARMFEPLSSEFEVADIVAFRARDLPDFPMGDRIGAAWDLDAIRAAHAEFLSKWESPSSEQANTAPLATMTMLVSDWLALLRKDPSLPAEYLGDEWPAAHSHAAYRRCRAALQVDAEAESLRFEQAMQRV